jgi:hypothetical protein
MVRLPAEEVLGQGAARMFRLHPSRQLPEAFDVEVALLNHVDEVLAKGKKVCRPDIESAVHSSRHAQLSLAPPGTLLRTASIAIPVIATVNSRTWSTCPKWPVMDTNGR